MTNANDTQARDQFNQWKAELALQAGADALTNVRGVLERARDEIERYSRRYQDYTAFSDKAEVMSWAINYLASGILGNCRLDLLASAQVQLATTAAAQRIPTGDR